MLPNMQFLGVVSATLFVSATVGIHLSKSHIIKNKVYTEVSLSEPSILSSSHSYWLLGPNKRANTSSLLCSYPWIWRDYKFYRSIVLFEANPHRLPIPSTALAHECLRWRR